MRYINKLKVLETQDFEKFCPSFYATAPDVGVSEKYAFLNTRDIATQLWKKGWLPVFAREARSMKPENKGFTKHIVRWAHKDFTGSGERIEIVGVNSHDRSCAFKFMAGVFRLVCVNSMIVQTSDFGSFKIVHIGDIAEQVHEAIEGIAASTAAIGSSMMEYKKIELSLIDQHTFAINAHNLIYKDPDSAPISPGLLLKPKRYADAANRMGGELLPKSDLWTTFNVVQENALKGGLRGTNAAGKRTKTRRINSIDKDVKLNQSLWQLTENFAHIKRAS